MSIPKKSIIIAVTGVMILGFISPALANIEIWTPFLPNALSGTIEYDGKTYQAIAMGGYVTFELSQTPGGYDEVTEFEEYLELQNMAPPYDVIQITVTTLTGLKESWGDPCSSWREGGYGLTEDDNMGRWSGVDARGVVFYGKWTTLPQEGSKYFDYTNELPARVYGWWILDGSSDGKASPTQIAFYGYWL